MSSKTTADPSGHLLYILNAISHLEGDLKINWGDVANDNGIGYGKNASQKFKTTLEKYGYKYESNRVTCVDGQINGTSVTSPATPKITKGANGKKLGPAKKSEVVKTPVGKKRKMDDVVGNVVSDDMVDDIEDLKVVKKVVKDVGGIDDAEDEV